MDDVSPQCKNKNKAKLCHVHLAHGSSEQGGAEVLPIHLSDSIVNRPQLSIIFILLNNTLKANLHQHDKTNSIDRNHLWEIFI